MAGIVRVWRDLNWLGADNQGLTRGAAEGGANQIPGALVFELVDFMREKKRLQLARDAVAEGRGSGRQRSWPAGGRRVVGRGAGWARARSRSGGGRVAGRRCRAARDAGE